MVYTLVVIKFNDFGVSDFTTVSVGVFAANASVHAKCGLSNQFVWVFPKLEYCPYHRFIENGCHFDKPYRFFSQLFNMCTSPFLVNFITLFFFSQHRPK